jgi:hypothetical protein
MVSRVRIAIGLVLANAALLYFMQSSVGQCRAALSQCNFVVANRLNCGWMGGDVAPMETGNAATLEPARQYQHAQSASQLYQPVAVADMKQGELIRVARVGKTAVPLTFFSAPRGFDHDTSARQVLVCQLHLPRFVTFVLL